MSNNSNNTFPQSKSRIVSSTTKALPDGTGNGPKLHFTRAQIKSSKCLRAMFTVVESHQLKHNPHSYAN